MSRSRNSLHNTTLYVESVVAGDSTIAQNKFLSMRGGRYLMSIANPKYNIIHSVEKLIFDQIKDVKKWSKSNFKMWPLSFCLDDNAAKGEGAGLLECSRVGIP